MENKKSKYTIPPIPDGLREISLRIVNSKTNDSITFNEVYSKELNVMDLTALTLCKENDLPIKVFNMNVKGNLKKVCNNDKRVGTLVRF